jgi:alpha-tubulin suppressor-like RCC1 family protein
MRNKPHKIRVIIVGLIILAGVVFFSKNFFENQQDVSVLDTANPIGREITFVTETSKEQESTLYVRGSNTYGELGLLGKTAAVDWEELTLPIPVALLAAGSHFTLALTPQGTVYAWGVNDKGQLGNKEVRRYNNEPTLIQTEGVSAISTKNNHVLLLKNDGMVWAFGSNYSRQLGDGTDVDRKEPVKVSGISGIKKIAAGYKISAAVDKNGEAWVWGGSCSDEHVDEQMEAYEEEDKWHEPATEHMEWIILAGDYNTKDDCYNQHAIAISSGVPVKIAGVNNITDVSAGYGHVLFLKNDGTVWGFGTNVFGQLGIGDFTDRPFKKGLFKAKLPSAAIQVSAGFRHSLALLDDGSVYAWGVNSKVMPNGMTFNGNLPLRVGITDVVKVYAGHDYSLFIKKDGSVWGMGSNESHVLSKNTSQHFIYPIKLTNSAKVDVFGAGVSHAVLLKK